ncbi:MAG: DNA polymerase I [Bacteroidota bacterium]
MPVPTQKLFLLDAMALIYRAHFAFSKNPRINSRGINTGAALGFTNALVEVIHKERPTHIVVAFDKATPTWRHQLYQAYKAHRQAQPEDITVAIPHIKQILEAFRIPVLEMEGYEADDIIGTLAYQAAREGFEVYMMTPDKDFGQLVGEHIYLYKPAYMGNNAIVLDTQALLAKWEIARVDQIRDILALQGDSSDNIPGVPTIGLKTAQKLIRQFGSVENLIAQASQLTGKLRENVMAYRQQAVLAKKLVTIHTDIPLQLDLAQSRYHKPDPEQLSAVFQQLEFRELARRVLGEEPKSSTSVPNSQKQLFEPTDPPAALKQPTARATAATLANIYTTPHQYHLIDTPALRQKLVSYLALQDTICLDTETTGLDPHQAALIGIAWAYSPGEAYYVPIPEDDAQARAIVEEFKPILESPTICKVGQNLKYDSLVLQRYGVEIAPPLFDTMIAHYLLAPERPHNMNAMAEEYLAYSPIAIETLIGRRGTTQKSMQAIDLELVKEYACEDADITLQLEQQLRPAIEQENLHKLLYEVELPLVRVLTAMEHHGVRVDTGVLQEISIALAKELQALTQEIYCLAGRTFNIDSPKQLGNVLFGQLRLTDKPKKTPSGQYATGELVLAEFAKDHEIVAKILEYRELQKLRSTYVDALPSLISPIDGRIHTSYNQTVVVTGRLSSTHPNLQNIPIRTARGRAIRKAFVPSSADHVLLAADYSQIELRIMASFAQDKTMIEAFKAGRDIHKATASRLFRVPPAAVSDSMRRQAKMANFGIIYGISVFGLAQRLGITRPRASRIIQAYFEEFPAIKAYMDSIISQARVQGYVTTLLGRKKYLRDINSRNANMRGFDERNAINAPIQGTAAEMIKLAMVGIHNWLRDAQLQAKMILQVHDELVFDVPQAEVAQLQAHVPLLMKNALPLTVPVEVELGIGRNWLEAH